MKHQLKTFLSEHLGNVTKQVFKSSITTYKVLLVSRVKVVAVK